MFLVQQGILLNNSFNIVVGHQKEPVCVMLRSWDYVHPHPYTAIPTLKSKKFRKDTSGCRTQKHRQV